ncbi:MAG: wax ester/triacylglycerol synthase family O-acyltransferase [Kordiimonadaceae bacterium]|nr:wax ester/triacylglycerol synthase family O-acyltransferase [Kordiimonadaceae bacterium]MBO6569198.1 wax ester/triacylglycerol synthase family O-acyltransferase [Kordiimonadaceae bacterium]MBO6964674.1 wax ester/triacylglycerol synthase family O-acyltransferase [Kordiimonadaceae bacterium]
MKQMQGLDAAFVAMEQPVAPVHIGSTSIYDPSTAPGGFVRYKDILSFIQDRLHLSETMRQKMVKVPFGIDYPYWVEDINFDLEFHVRHVALPKPGDWRQLCIQAARIFARPLDLSRPPWEITIVEGLDNVEGIPKGSYAMITKVHHAAIDGASGVDMMKAMHTLTAATEPPATKDEWRPESDPSQLGMFMRGYVRSLSNPLRQMRAFAKSAPGMAKAAGRMLSGEIEVGALLKAPKTRFNGTVSPHRMFDARTFAIEDVNKIRALSEGSKLNDVMLSVVGGAMRLYMESKRELPEETVTAMAPISVRTEGERNTMGNQVAAMFVPLGSHIADAAERMKFVHEETGKAKGLTDTMGARDMAEMAKLSSAPMMNIGSMLYTRLKIADRIKPFINTVVTNVPGPPVPIYSAGAQLVAHYGMLCLVDGTRLGHVVQSYMGKITLSFTADRNAVPDPDFYAECIQKSYDAHVRAAAKLAAPEGKAKAKAKPKAKAAAASKAKAEQRPDPKLH